MNFAFLLFSILYGTAALLFSHPGALNTKAQLDFVKSQVKTGAQPWTDEFNTMMISEYATRTPHGMIRVYSTIGYQANTMRDDAFAAYTQALIWYLSGTIAYGDSAIAILNSWASLQGFVSGNGQDQLLAGWTGALFAPAAEILRLFSGWSAGNIASFQAMFRRAFYPQLNSMSTWNGNSDLTQIDAMISIAVFNEDEDEFNFSLTRLSTRIPAYFYLSSAGPAPNIDGDGGNVAQFWFNPLRWVDGLTQETCRDYGHHQQFGMGSALHVMESAWHQGVDIYTPNQERMVAAMELQARCFVTNSMQQLCSSGQIYPSTNRYNTWEIGYNHYHNRKGISLPNTWKLITTQIRPNAFRDSRGWNIAYETLTHGNLTNNLLLPTPSPTVMPSSVVRTSTPSQKPSFSPIVLPSRRPTALPIPNPTPPPTTIVLTSEPTLLPSTKSTLEPSISPSLLLAQLPSIILPTNYPPTQLSDTPTILSTTERPQLLPLPSSLPIVPPTILPSQLSNTPTTLAITEKPLSQPVPPSSIPTSEFLSPSPTVNLLSSQPSSSPQLTSAPSLTVITASPTSNPSTARKITPTLSPSSANPSRRPSNTPILICRPTAFPSSTRVPTASPSLLTPTNPPVSSPDTSLQFTQSLSLTLGCSAISADQSSQKALEVTTADSMQLPSSYVRYSSCSDSSASLAGPQPSVSAVRLHVVVPLSSRSSNATAVYATLQSNMRAALSSGYVTKKLLETSRLLNATAIYSAGTTAAISTSATSPSVVNLQSSPTTAPFPPSHSSPVGEVNAGGISNSNSPLTVIVIVSAVSGALCITLIMCTVYYLVYYNKCTCSSSGVITAQPGKAAAADSSASADRATEWDADYVFVPVERTVKKNFDDENGKEKGVSHSGSSSFNDIFDCKSRGRV